MIFAFTISPNRSSEVNALLLVESIRNFAGSLSKNPIWCLVQENGKGVREVLIKRLETLDALIIPYKKNEEFADFPFAGYIQAAALAESRVTSQPNLLTWLGEDTIILQEPKHLLLPRDKSLGYRPVHHLVIGSPYNKPPDEFWKLVYNYCKVQESQIFPMITHIDGVLIRPYFNAGILVTRPENQLLKKWHDIFFQVYQEPDFKRFYDKDERYRIFIHQVILTSVILTTFTSKEMQELPPVYNYPLHLYLEDTTGNRPGKLEDLVTFRHEAFHKATDWPDKMPAGKIFKKWLKEKLRALPS